MRTFFLTIAAAAIVAWTGFPVPRVLNSKLEVVRFADIAASVRAAGAVPVPGPAERWRDSAWLVVLASGLFAAAIVVNRRANRVRARLRRHPAAGRRASPALWPGAPAAPARRDAASLRAARASGAAASRPT